MNECNTSCYDGHHGQQQARDGLIGGEFVGIILDARDQKAPRTFCIRDPISLLPFFASSHQAGIMQLERKK